MLDNKRRLIVTYAVLVGVPLLGLAGIIAGGQGIQAPALVAGTWKVECDIAGAGECFAFPSMITIAQSGPHLRLTTASGHPIAVGVLDGSAMRLRIEHSPPLCFAEILARISGPPNRRTFAGQALAYDDSRCVAVQVRGVQMSAKRIP